MGLTTIFGINGVGKDTVVEKLMQKNSKIKATSMSRINMYILGITETYDLQEKVTEEQYKALESIPQNIMIDIENNQYRKVLEEISQSDEDIVFLAHLVTALRLGKKVNYLTDRLTPEWFIEINKNLIQLVAPEDLIAERRIKDCTRKRETKKSQILEHQKLCDREWDRIASLGNEIKEKMHIVENINLDQAVKDVESIIFEKNKKLYNNFIKELKVDVNYDRVKQYGMIEKEHIKEEVTLDEK